MTQKSGKKKQKIGEISGDKMTQLQKAEKIFNECPSVTCRKLMLDVPTNYPTSIIRDLKERGLQIEREEKMRQGENFYRYYLKPKETLFG